MNKICFFNTTGFWGGGEKLILEYALKFKGKNYSVYLAAGKDSPLSKKARENDIEVFEIRLRNLSFINIFKYFRLLRFFKSENIDTAIFTTSPDLKTGGIASKLAHINTIVYLRGLTIPIKNTFLNRILFKDILTHIVASSLETKTSMLKQLGRSIHIDDNVRVIYHGIDLEQFDEGSTSIDIQRVPGEIILGTAGRLHPQKGHPDLIKVAERLKKRGLKFRLLIAGTGDQRPELEKMIDDLHLRNEVILLGFIEDIPGFMRSIDIFIMASSREGFGFVLAEAMAASKPVVAYNITSPEIVRDNQTGFLAEYQDLDMFSEKIGILIKDPDERSRLGTNGRKVVEECFQLNDRMNELENYLNG